MAINRVCKKNDRRYREIKSEWLAKYNDTSGHSAAWQRKGPEPLPLPPFPPFLPQQRVSDPPPLVAPLTNLYNLYALIPLFSPSVVPLITNSSMHFVTLSPLFYHRGSPFKYPFNLHEEELIWNILGNNGSLYISKSEKKKIHSLAAAIS